MYSCLFSKEHYLCKLDGVAPLVADPSPANSTTDSETQPISHGQHTFLDKKIGFVLRQISPGCNPTFT